MQRAIKIRKVLAGTDFSPASEVAIEAAGRLASRLDAGLTVAHAFDPMPVPPVAITSATLWPPVDLSDKLGQLADEQLAAWRDSKLAGVPHESVTLSHANAALALCNYAAEHDVDLAIVGTHGRVGVKRLVMGSVAERVIRHAPCAVMAAREGAADPGFASHILVCTDFSPAAEAGLELGESLASTLGSAVSLVHVQDRWAWRRAADAADGSTVKAVESQLQGMLDRTAKRFETKPNSAVILHESVPRAIVQHAKEVAADLIVLATHGRSGIARFAIGSVAERVTRHAHCSVMVARSAASSFVTQVV